jgi:hypothetical protein
MTTLREAAQQALEALEERYVGALRDKAMDALKAALEQPEREPELRRLHAVNQELLEALKFVIRGVPDTWEGVQKARAAIAKAEGQA